MLDEWTVILARWKKREKSNRRLSTPNQVSHLIVNVERAIIQIIDSTGSRQVTRVESNWLAHDLQKSQIMKRINLSFKPSVLDNWVISEFTESPVCSGLINYDMTQMPSFIFFMVWNMNIATNLQYTWRTFRARSYVSWRRKGYSKYIVIHKSYGENDRYSQTNTATEGGYFQKQIESVFFGGLLLLTYNRFCKSRHINGI